MKVSMNGEHVTLILTQKEVEAVTTGLFEFCDSIQDQDKGWSDVISFHTNLRKKLHKVEMSEAKKDKAKKISKKDKAKFSEYVRSFYDPKQKDVLYPVKDSKILEAAIEIYISGIGRTWGRGDSVDREAVRSIYGIITGEKGEHFK